ncbi:hypothetical protein NKJ74_20430 [Mesorhizobium sp. M0046]|uniref:hypothetical protein n=1 Tax=Mesorhizobium sp. M0046 TaxID=2956858 RepID=UPI0033397A0F
MLSGTGRPSEATRKQVLAAADELCCKVFLRHEGGRDRPLSCRQYGELLGQGGIWVERVPCLSLVREASEKSGLRRQLDEVAARRVEGAIADDADIGTVTTASSMTP